VVPEKNRGFNPKKHVARPPEPNPWEICTQLHCGAGIEGLMGRKETAGLLQERKNTIGFFGPAKSGKTFLMHMLLGYDSL